ncbi:MAG: SCP2 sterol-binding domain-containing protein [bacterium]
MATYFGIAVDDIFNTMQARFRPEGAAGMDAVLAYDITGDGGGCWKITVKDNTVKIENTDDLAGFSVKTTVDAETFVGISIGKVDGMSAFSSGKMKVEGDMSLLAASPRLFNRFTPPKKGVTVHDIFATLVERFRPENATDLDMTIGYNIGGDDGGQWTAVIKDGKCVLETGLRADATITQIVTAKDFVDLVLGKLDPMVAIGAGRLRIAGDMKAAGIVPKLFAKFTPADAGEEQELIVLKRNISVNMKYSTGRHLGMFLDALKEKKIIANICPKCGRYQLPPREVCAECRCRVEDFKEVGPGGVITLIEDVYYASPDPLTGETRETPYGTVHVLLDGCTPDCTFWHFLKNEDLGNTKEGDRVQPVWAEKRDGGVHDILYFEKENG